MNLPKTHKYSVNRAHPTKVRDKKSVRRKASKVQKASRKANRK